MDHSQAVEGLIASMYLPVFCTIVVVGFFVNYFLSPAKRYTENMGIVVMFAFVWPWILTLLLMVVTGAVIYGLAIGSLWVATQAMNSIFKK